MSSQRGIAAARKLILEYPTPAPRRDEADANPAALLRLAGAVLVEQHDEWEAGDRRYFSESSMLELKTMNDPTTTIEETTTLPELIAA